MLRSILATLFCLLAACDTGPVTSPDGTLYAGSLDETLYAIESGF